MKLLRNIAIVGVILGFTLGVSSCDTTYSLGFEANGCTVNGNARATDTSWVHFSGRYSNCDDTYWTRQVCVFLIGSGSNDDYSACTNWAFATADATHTIEAFCYTGRTYTFILRFYWNWPGNDGGAASWTESTQVVCQSVAANEILT